MSARSKPSPPSFNLFTMAQLCSLLPILASIGLFSNPSMAHLAGILSQSIEDSELLTAVITNTGPQHIAVLKHNTILDTSHLSMPCRIAENGKPLRMGGSHVMYSGIGKSDLLNLAPGSNFTRHLNMTDYIGHGLADGAQSSRTITASLPSMLQGRESQDGSYQILRMPWVILRGPKREWVIHQKQTSSI